MQYVLCVCYRTHTFMMDLVAFYNAKKYIFISICDITLFIEKDDQHGHTVGTGKGVNYIF